MRFTSVGASLCASDGEESPCNAGDLGSIPGLGHSPGEGTDYPLQYSCLGNSMDRGSWQATVRRVTESRTTEQLTPAPPPNHFVLVCFSEDQF